MAGCLPVLPAFYKFHLQRHTNDITAYTNPTMESATTRKTPKLRCSHSISTTELVSSDVQLEDVSRNESDAERTR